MVRASVSEIYDLSTQTGQGTVLKIHTPVGTNIKRHLVGHFLQYKRYRYVGAKITLIPASTLPADPLQVSYEAGEPTIDPRDMVNPILWKHYHGEGMLTDSLKIQSAPVPYGSEASAYSYFGNSVDEQLYQDSSGAATQGMFYAHSLMDESFRKASVQRGFTTFVKPYAYNLASTFQISANVPEATPTGAPWDQVGFTVREDGNASDPWGPVKVQDGTSASPGSWFTNKLTRLGWMDTMQNAEVAGQNGMGDAGMGMYNCLLPNVPMLYVLFPPAYKTEFYFRLVIKHLFEFGGFRSAFSVQSWGAYSQVGLVPASPTSMASALAEMIGGLADGGPDTVDVENGSILPCADGASGE